MNIVVDILALLMTLGILVTIHEYGHFWVARRCGVKVERFSIGFGKAIFSWRRGETEYRIAAIPLGGYVKMLGENQDDVDSADKHRSFSQKPLIQKAAIVAAGPLANFALAIVLYWLMFIVGVNGYVPRIGDITAGSPAHTSGLLVGDEIVAVDGKPTRTWNEVQLQMVERQGESGVISLTLKAEGMGNERVSNITIERWLADAERPDILGSLGIGLYPKTILAKIEEVLPGGRAQSGGLLAEDIVISVDGESIANWTQWVEIVQNSAEVDLLVLVERGSGEQVLTIRPELNSNNTENAYGYIGARPVTPRFEERQIKYSVFSALPEALNKTWNSIFFTLGSMKKVVVGLISVKNFGGPITIAQVAGQTVTDGLEYYISFLAVLSISLGVLNLLPIPVLDGGHLFYYLVEAIIRRPVPEKIQAMGMQFGMLLLAGFMIIVFYNDVNRLF